MTGPLGTGVLWLEMLWNDVAVGSACVCQIAESSRHACCVLAAVGLVPRLACAILCNMSTSIVTRCPVLAGLLTTYVATASVSMSHLPAQRKAAYLQRWHEGNLS